MGGVCVKDRMSVCVGVLGGGGGERVWRGVLIIH